MDMNRAQELAVEADAKLTKRQKQLFKWLVIYMEDTDFKSNTSPMQMMVAVGECMKSLEQDMVAVFEEVLSAATKLKEEKDKEN